jgi:hypothetical protein
MNKRIMLIALALAPLAAGCGNDCQSTCQRIYGDKPNCQINSAGTSPDEREVLVTQCEDHCKQALEKPGPVRSSFKPNERTPKKSSVELTTDKEAALWMDCVEATACDLLEDGYCAPIF